MNDDAENSTNQRVIGRPFVKGQSGNPGGRPKGLADLRAMCRDKAELALATLESECRAGGSTGIAAARVLLEYGFGKASAVPEVEASVTPRWIEEMTKEEAMKFLDEIQKSTAEPV